MIRQYHVISPIFSSDYQDLGFQARNVVRCTSVKTSYKTRRLFLICGAVRAQVKTFHDEEAEVMAHEKGSVRQNPPTDPTASDPCTECGQTSTSVQYTVLVH